MPPATAHRTSPAPLDALRRHLPLAAISLIVLISLVGTIVLLRGGTIDAASLLDAVAGEVERNYLAMLALFALWSFATLLLVIPGGTISLFAAGFLFGWAPAAAVYVAMILPATLILDGIGRRQLGARLATYLACHLPARLALAPAVLRAEGLSTVIALRMAPVVPNAVMCLLVASLGISRRDLILGTLAAAWVRPVLVAGAGSMMRSASDLLEPGAVDFRLLLALLIAALALLVWRIISRLQRLRADRPVAEAA